MPTAVLNSPTTLILRALAPTAVLPSPSVLFIKDKFPTVVLSIPLVLAFNALAGLTNLISGGKFGKEFNFPSFQSGSPGEVRQSGLAFLHKGEQVINPRNGEQPFRGITNNSGGNITQMITVNVQEFSEDVLVNAVQRARFRLEMG